MTAAPLTDDEIARIKTELWDHVLSIGAEPYIGFHPVFNTVRDYVLSSATPATSSSTAVTTAPVQTTLVVVDATGYTVGCKIVVDCDDSREVCSVRSLATNVVGVSLRKNHAGTYPVEIESPRTIVRGILFDLSKLETTIADALDTSGVKRADEVEFFGPNDGGNTVTQLLASQYKLRLELARRVGLGAYAARNRSSDGYEQY